MFDIDIDKWERFGKGRITQFYVTDDDVFDVLKNFLINEYMPYTIILSFLEKVNKHYEERYQECSIDEFLYLRMKGYNKFFIRSQIISPILNIPSNKILKYFSNNGLIHLLHGIIYESGWGASSLSMINKVINIENNVIIYHSEYERIYNSLKRGFRKLMKYQTIERMKDGHLIVAKNVYMSQSFVNKCESGEIISKALPGNLLK